MTANPGGALVGETDMMTTRRPRSDPLSRGQGRQYQEGAIHTERTMLTRRLVDDMSMLALRKDGPDDGRPLRIGAARVETFGGRSAGSIGTRIAQWGGDRRLSQFAPTWPSRTSSPTGVVAKSRV
jgi:hypothetical protein